jgi:glycosyltransferase involved in cell wall biosynthesis
MAASWGPGWAADARCRVVYNGIDTAPYAAAPDREGVCREFGIPATDTLYIHVGRMDEPKNHVRLAGIFGAIVRQDPNSRLLLVGRGGNDIERRVRERLAELGAVGRVTFAGMREDVPRLLKAADVMVFPSLNEGLPGAVLEACAAGTPVLASRLDTIEEVAAHLPLVETLPLEVDDAQWAERARTLAAGGRVNGFRQHASAAFASSVFGIEQCVNVNTAVWGAAQRG